MNIAQARDNEGKRVRYQPVGGRPEYGVLTGFSTLCFVFVRYDGDQQSKATPPGDLELVDTDAESIRCPQCGWVSYNPNDVRERYCGHCHQYHDVMART